MQQTISLKELLLKVKRVVGQSFPSTYWVSADISDLHEDLNRGHCYLELVEKNDNRLVEAKIRASIWANTYAYLKPYFLKETGQPLQTGMKILVEVSLSFHEQYGMSCVIQNIDPTFTVGDIARKKLQTIQRLKEDGIWDMNREIVLPMLLKRLAVISSESAAGYGDFCNQLQTNERGFHFSFQLFPAIMQGDQSAQSIIDALDRVYAQQQNFDAVVIIRGGGATTDLLAFDEYELAASVAQFPLPVITGIGHERDESVTDMVANTRCKTPTAVAAFIYEKMLSEETRLLDDEAYFRERVDALLTNENERLENVMNNLSRSITFCMDMEMQRLTMRQQQLKASFGQCLKNHQHDLEIKENTLRLCSPETLLKKGYSITTYQGRIIKNTQEITSGALIETIFANGKIKSIVE